MAVTIDGSGSITGVPGSILQVVQGKYETQVQISSTSLADTGLSATITPTSSSSKILVTVTQQYFLDSTNYSAASIQLLRDSTGLLTDVNGRNLITYANGASAVSDGSMFSISYLDSPATASAVTYKTQARVQLSGHNIYLQRDNATSTITLMEVAA